MAKINEAVEVANQILEQGDLNIDRHRCKRVVPMQVLSLGLSRTGTLSMKTALKILGYNETYHWFNLYGNIQDTDMWIEAFNAKYYDKGKPFGRAEFDQLLGHCAAVTDAPCVHFGRELIDAYPEAKVVLVERDFSSWYNSFCVISDSAFNPVVHFLGFLDPTWSGRHTKLALQWLHSCFGKSPQDVRNNLRKIYDDHYTLIRKVTPPERLLEYKLGSGWEPLCKFLGKPIPDVPFPRVNEGEQMKTNIAVLSRKIMMHALRNVAIVLSSLVVLGFSVYLCFNFTEVGTS